MNFIEICFLVGILLESNLQEPALRLRGKRQQEPGPDVLDETKRNCPPLVGADSFRMLQMSRRATLSMQNVGAVRRLDQLVPGQSCLVVFDSGIGESG